MTVATIPMRTPEEVGRAMGLVAVAARLLREAAWAEAAAAWRRQLDASAAFDPTLFLRATSGAGAVNLRRNLRLAEAAAAFLREVDAVAQGLDQPSTTHGRAA